MEQDGPSFWADIKKYEDTLDKDPNSYCFAPLSELYRKIGMVDDAISVARRGCDLHPDYVGGYMALGRAYHEKGMSSECRAALEKVVRITPDNLLALKILGQIYIDAGEIVSAEKALQSILAQNPDDVESRMLLNSLIRVAMVDRQTAAEAKTRFDKTNAPRIAEQAKEIHADNETGGFSFDLDPEVGEREGELNPEDYVEEILDLLEADIVEEPPIEEDEEAEPYPEQSGLSCPEPAGAEGVERKDPLTTATLAELYVSQGFPEKALAIYTELLTADPGNEDLKKRLIALETGMNKDVASAGEELVIQEDTSPVADASAELPFPVDAQPMEVDGINFDEPFESDNQSPAASEERVIHTLEMWLENIRRRR